MTHYVYLLNSKTQEKYYIGARSCKCSISEDTYMGSSSVMTKDDKANCNKIILKRFKTRKEAIQYEIELHEKFNVASNTLFWNKSKQTSTGFDTTGIPTVWKGKKRSAEQKKKQSEAMKGRVGHWKGKNIPDSVKEAVSKSSKRTVKCPHCEKEGNLANMGRWHFDYCLKNPNGLPRPKINRDYTMSEEQKKKISDTKKGQKMKTKFCESCKTYIGLNNFSRHICKGI